MLSLTSRLTLLSSLCLALSFSAGAAAPEAASSARTPTGAAAPTATALPSDSLYQMPLALTDQDGQALPLNHWRGQPLLVSMFYTSCEYVCPMIVEGIQATQAQLSPVERDQVHVLMLSFDPTRDTVAVLRQQTAQRQLDTRQWTLARTSADSTRKLASALGIQYRALKNGDFNHTAAVILLDRNGRLLGRTTQLSTADPTFVRLLKATLQTP